MQRKVLNTIKGRRTRRTRGKLFGTKNKPRLSVFRSNRHLYVQLIDDQDKKTLASASTYGSREEKGSKTKEKKTKADAAKILGERIAEKAVELNIASVIFDRGRYKYHGRVRAVAEAARAKGLKF